MRHVQQATVRRLADPGGDHCLPVDRPLGDRTERCDASTVVTVERDLLALVKVRIIIREFMEVRHAPLLLCRLTDLWVVLIGVCLIGSYFVGSAIAP